MISTTPNPVGACAFVAQSQSEPAGDKQHSKCYEASDYFEYYEASDFGDKLGAKEMANRFNEASMSLISYREFGMRHSGRDIGSPFVANLPDIFGVSELVVSDRARKQFAVCLLGVSNIIHKNVILLLTIKIAEPNLDPTSYRDDSERDKVGYSHKVGYSPSEWAMDYSLKDKDLHIEAPSSEGDNATKSMMQLRNQLAYQFVESKLKNELSNPDQFGVVCRALTQAVNQITAGTDMGGWPMEAKAFEELTSDAVCEITAGRNYRDEGVQEKQVKSFKGLQAAFLDSKSALMTNIFSHSLVVDDLDEEKRCKLKGMLESQSGNGTITNELSMVLCLAAQDEELKIVIEAAGYSFKDVDVLAKGNMILNYLDKSKLSNLLNDDLNM